jgi:hypothetical protein
MRRSHLCVIALPLLAVLAGCEDKPKKSATAPAARVKARETLHKTTQEVLKLQDALENGGVLAATDIPEADPLTQNAAAYRTTVGKISGMAVEKAIQIRKAQNIMEDDKPMTYETFMSEIIKKGQPEGIQLAMLPYYQEYAWDETKQKLVVVEFPAKKAQFQDQQDKMLGRK